MTSPPFQGEWKGRRVSVHTVFYLYNNSATIHIHLYIKDNIYSHHIRERTGTWGVTSIISLTQ